MMDPSLLARRVAVGGSRAQTNDRLHVSDAHDLGCHLHTALRKVCDNTVTSLAYNLIALEEMTGAWRSYLAFAWDRLQDVTDEAGMVEALRNAAEKLDFGAHDRNALRCCFKLFEDDDFKTMGAWVLKVEEG